MSRINFTDLNLKFLQDHSDEAIIIDKEGIDFHFKLSLKQLTNKLVIFSNGAVDPSKRKPPVFMRSNWVDDMDYNALFIDDRTIHGNNLRLGWGVGEQERHYLADYSAVVHRITELLTISSNNTFYYGSSAGGFMSMALASMHKGSTAIVNNPQTYVFKYFESAVDALYSTVFPGMTHAEVNKNYSNRLSITNIFRRSKHTPKVLYFQNRLCNGDMENHLTPFIKTLEKYQFNMQSIQFILYNDKKAGHNPMSKDKTLELLDLIVNGKEDEIKTVQQVVDYSPEKEADLKLTEQSVFPLLPYSNHTVPMADAAIENRIIPFPTFEAVPLSDSIWDIQKGADTVSYQLYLHSWRVVSELLNQYTATKDKKYIDKATEIIHSWMDNSEARMTTMTWYDHPTANRTQVLIEYMHIIKTINPEADFSRYIEQLNKHCHFLMDDTNYRPNNHGLMMDRTLMVAGIVLSNELFLLKGKARAQQSFWINYSPNGVHLENSPEYHRMVTRMYHSIEDYLKKNDETLGPEIIQLLTLADAYLPKIAKPDRRIPAIGDSSEMGSPSKVTLWENFQDISAGITVLKDKPNQLYLAFICGFSTATHKHPDDLSIILNYKNQDFFIDAGKFNYSRSPGRSYVVSRPAHSSYQLHRNYKRTHDNRIIQAIKTDHFFDTEDFSIVSGYHHGYEGAKLRRTIYFLKKFHLIFIEDVGESETEVNFINRFNLCEGLTIEEGQNSIKLSKNDASIEVLNLTGQPYEINDKAHVKGVKQPFNARKVNQKLATKQIVITDQAKVENKFLTLIRLEEAIDVKIYENDNEYIFNSETNQIKLPKI
ncbi:heparinase II/III domain-containing protein [Macrococcus brunensis]|uniref:heparinase II/III domain-containing protein n=1 Tax=Macrococcus brunensis TaxID=198483 RepID=UPI001EF14390|nr:heparinase II/III family protein [Macrococcus brunensis]ULG74941.1 heparinase II/III family protein [Macrococcus brunensis]